MSNLAELKAIADRLRSRVAQPTWVTVAGYGSEQVHASVLAYALTQPHLARKRLLAELWTLATGEPLDPAKIQDEDLFVRPQERVADGPDGVLSLLVTFHVEEEVWRLGLDVKVDGMPRPEQGAKLFDGMRERGGTRCALVLVALGSSRVSLPSFEATQAWKHIWTPETFLALGPRILAAAGVDYVIGPWLDELETEQLRREVASYVRPEEAEALGYRGRTLAAYTLEGLCRETNKETDAAWQIVLRPHGIVAKAEGLTRYKLMPRVKIWFNLELGEHDLQLKAWSEPRLPDLQNDTSAIAVQACRLFWTYGLLASPPPNAKLGNTATLLSIPLRISGSSGVTTLVRASRAWESIASALALRA